MARRRRGGDAAGFLFLVVIGLFAMAAEFVAKNWAIISGLLIVAAIVAVIAGLVRLIRRERVEPPAAALPLVRVTVENDREDDLDLWRLPAARPRGPPARWVQPGEPVRVQGLAISGGMFYLGKSLPGSDRSADDKCVVDPDLPIGSGGPDIPGASMPYWPSYSEVGPGARRAFLQWMAGGRCDPAYGIGYVFLFFYGLEHRLFREGKAEEAGDLITEVERLLTIYGSSGSFVRYAGEFLFHARLLTGTLGPPELSPDLVQRRYAPEYANAVRVHLGALIARGEAIGADDALLWIVSLPTTSVRTPVVRCFGEFVALWRLRFAAKYPQGLRVRPSKRLLQFTYSAASGGFPVRIPGPHESYPDIQANTGPVSALDQLLQSCAEDLGAYSRFLGRQPDGRKSLQGAMHLPPELRSGADNGALKDLAADISRLFGQRDTAVLTMRKLIEMTGFEAPKPGKLPKATANGIVRILDSVDVGMEPDARFGGAGPATADDAVVVFRATGGGKIDAERPEYRAMRAQVEVAALAAAADGEACSDDFQTVLSLVKSAPGMSRVEQARLLAYAVTLFKSPLKQSRILKRIAERPPAERRAIAQAAAIVVGAKGHAGAEEVRFLERLHNALGLPREGVYEELHRATESPAAADEPVAVIAERRSRGVPIPPVKPKGVGIDADRLARVRRETEAVSQLLTSIFGEDGKDEGPKVSSPEKERASAFPGLDEAHAGLLDSVVDKGEVARSEFDAMARARKLLPDGAIETINEWAFDRLDEPLLEDGEMVRLDPELKVRLDELREAT